MFYIGILELGETCRVARSGAERRRAARSGEERGLAVLGSDKDRRMDRNFGYRLQDWEANEGFLSPKKWSHPNHAFKLMDPEVFADCMAFCRSKNGHSRSIHIAPDPH